MRGQKLFVRAIEAGDAANIRDFFASNATRDAAPACGLIGKLLGRLVAVMAISFSEPDSIRIDDLLVDRELRRKRIGRVMLSELEAFAEKMERDWLIADPAGDSREFLRRVGFVEEGQRMIKKVAR
ncbi:MAG TPA: GNAT family N-acetyltransferase [Thermoanaerobaculia bacterium]|nr:GNAT family N-acetyltransferase [Thermoanaerobaculia bacterium]